MWTNIKIPYEKKSTSPAFEIVLICLLLVALAFWFHP